MTFRAHVIPTEEPEMHRNSRLNYISITLDTYSTTENITILFPHISYAKFMESVTCGLIVLTMQLCIRNTLPNLPHCHCILSFWEDEVNASEGNYIATHSTN